MGKLRNLSLFKQFIFLIGTILVILLLSFVVSNNIAINIIKVNSYQSSEKILLQVEDKINIFYTDMYNISLSLIYSPTIKNYIQTEDALERILAHNDVLSVFSNTFSLKENIRGIELYNNELISTVRIGEGLNGRYDLSSVSTTSYTGILDAETNQASMYYAIIAPIFDLEVSSMSRRLGTCVLVMNKINFDQLLQNSLLTKNSVMLLLDQNDNIIASEGLVKDDSFDLKTMENNSKYFIQTVSFPKTGWEIVSVIPKKELYDEMNTVQRFNVVAYMLIVGILTLFLIIFFIGILKPVNELIRFMQAYPKYQQDERIKNISNNEIGRIGYTLNSMLDDMDMLSIEIQESQKQIYEIEIIKQQMEIASYKNQINPHFLYNTFECIRAMAFYYKAEHIAEITEALSKLFRYSVKGGNYATVEEELSIIKEYARIIDFRFMGRIGISIDVENSILTEGIIKVLLQPIVENAVFHGLEKVIDGGLINIQVSRTEDNKIQFIIEDNGIGMDDEQVDKLLSFLEEFDILNAEKSSNDGVGLLNIYRRLKLFYKEEVEFIIWSKRQVGTKVTIKIPPLNSPWEGEKDV